MHGCLSHEWSLSTISTHRTAIQNTQKQRGRLVVCPLILPTEIHKPQKENLTRKKKKSLLNEHFEETQVSSSSPRKHHVCVEHWAKLLQMITAHLAASNWRRRLHFSYDCPTVSLHPGWCRCHRSWAIAPSILEGDQGMHRQIHECYLLSDLQVWGGCSSDVLLCYSLNQCFKLYSVNWFLNG